MSNLIEELPKDFIYRDNRYENMFKKENVEIGEEYCRLDEQDITAEGDEYFVQGRWHKTQNIGIRVKNHLIYRRKLYPF